MKIKNPNFKDENEIRMEKYDAIINTYITNLPIDKEFIDFAEIRADILAMNLPGVTAQDLPDWKLMDICIRKNIEFEE